MALPTGSCAGSRDMSQRRLPMPVSVSVWATCSHVPGPLVGQDDTMSATPKWQNICKVERPGKPTGLVACVAMRNSEQTGAGQQQPGQQPARGQGSVWRSLQTSWAAAYASAVSGRRPRAAGCRAEIAWQCPAPASRPALPPAAAGCTCRRPLRVRAGPEQRIAQRAQQQAGVGPQPLGQHLVFALARQLGANGQKKVGRRQRLELCGRHECRLT